MLFFPLERAAEVLHAWREWTATVPDEVTSVGRVLRFPPFPEIPEPLRGNSFAVVEAVFLGAEAAGAELLRPLRALGPRMDTFAMVPPAGIAELHMDPREPVPGVTSHTLLGKLPPRAIDDLVAACGAESGSSLLSVEPRHTGGALGRPQEGNGALAALAGEFASFGVGIAAEPGIAAKSAADLAAVEAALAPTRSAATSTSPRSRPTSTASSTPTRSSGCARSSAPTTPTPSSKPTTRSNPETPASGRFPTLRCG